MYIYIYVCICVYIYTYLSLYIYMHVYIPLLNFMVDVDLKVGSTSLRKCVLELLQLCNLT